MKINTLKEIRGSFHPFIDKAIILLIFFTGIILRLRQYLTGRSLWLDEAMLGLNIVNRDFINLFRPLDYDQGAPIGFLLVEKIFSLLFGHNEYALRFLPFILGVLSLYLFYILLGQYTNGISLVITFALFALNPFLIYYTSELKQYIADVFFVILLLILARDSKRASPNKLPILTFAGCLALWFSHPSIFILAGIGISLLISALQEKDRARLSTILIVGIAWVFNVFILYSLTLKNLQSNSFMQEYWSGAFAPMPPWSNLSWYWESFIANANSLFVISYFQPVLLLLILFGYYFLHKKHPEMAITLGWVVIFALMASSLTLYPSHERLALYLTPIILLLIGIALGHVEGSLANRKGLRYTFLLITCGYLFWGSIPTVIEQLRSPKYFEHIRPTMKYLQRSWKDNDSLYVSYGGVPAFEFYAPVYDMEETSYLSGKREDYKDSSALLETLNALKGRKRVWVLFSHVYENDGFNERDFLLDYLKKNGRKTLEYRESGTSVFLYLFDLSQ